MGSQQKLLTSPSIFNILMIVTFLEHFQMCFEMHLLPHISYPFFIAFLFRTLKMFNPFALSMW